MKNLFKFRKDIYNFISITEITFLADMDKRIEINKNGKFKYYNFLLGTNKIFDFLKDLEDTKIYIVIPMLSKNARSDQPYFILDRQILLTNKSDYMLIAKHISSKYNETLEIYELDDNDDLILTFKYKEVRIDLNQNYKFK